jgi:membrane-bound lytic murein transglycosylase F
MMVKKGLIYFIFILLTSVDSCIRMPDAIYQLQTSFEDLDKIMERGKLIAVTDFNSIDYFVYKGEPMGFQYEMLRSFSGYLGLDIEIIAVNDIPESLAMLNSGKADLLAYGLAVNASGKRVIRFSDPLTVSRQVLVQRKPATWRSMALESVERNLIRDQNGLAGKTIYVQRGSASVSILKNIERETGEDIEIIEVPYVSEELISLVADGEIDYTVCDENVGKVNAYRYPAIDVKTPVSIRQNIAWGMRKTGSDQLAKAAAHWMKEFRKSGTYALLYAKYFKNDRSGAIVRSDYFTINTGKISPWDDVIRAYSDSIRWDWRLLASLVYQESRFRANAVSHSGAFGLMQVLPSTGANLGIDIRSSPRNNIRAGTRYLARLDSIFRARVPDANERLRFILAAYNAGPGHVLDAIELARKNGNDPERWNGNVEMWMLRKSEPKYYNDTVVKNGYFRGRESVAFVSEILDRYHHYKNLIP